MSEIPSSDWTWINAAADRFERAWKQGPRPRIGDYLAEVDEHQRAALREELLQVECELRRRAGEEPGLEEYAPRFPRHATLTEAVFGPRPDRSATSGLRHDLPTLAPGTTNGRADHRDEPEPGTRVCYFGDYGTKTGTRFVWYAFRPRRSIGPASSRLASLALFRNRFG